MSDLIIKKLNESYVKIECERHFAQELYHFFSFRVPGYQFMPAYKNKVWDGYLHLFSLRDNTLYHGLFPHIVKFCKERNYTFYVEPEITYTDELSLVEAVEFINTLELPYEIRDYQLQAFVHAIRNRRILIVSPTASGKSLILYVILRYLQFTNNKRGLIIVPTTSLCYQMYKDFDDYSQNDDNFNIEDEVSIIMAGKDKNPTVDRIKITLENEKIVYYKPHQKIKTKNGIKFAKNLTTEDDIL